MICAYKGVGCRDKTFPVVLKKNVLIKYPHFSDVCLLLTLPGKTGFQKIVFLFFSPFFYTAASCSLKKSLPPFVFKFLHLWNARLSAHQPPRGIPCLIPFQSFHYAGHYLQTKLGISFLSFLDHSLIPTSLGASCLYNMSVVLILF